MARAKRKEAPTGLFGAQEPQDATETVGAATAPSGIKPAQVAAAAPPGAQETKAVAVRKAPAPALPTRRQPGQVRSSAGELMNAITQAATNPAVDVVKMEKLLEMFSTLQAKENRDAFDIALAEMQPHLPIIERKGRIVVREKDARGERTGKIQQDTPYARWEDVNEAITPVLSHFGFSLSFRVKGGAGTNVEVTGILSGHGHREETSITLAHDSTGSKNAAQAIVSSVSYGKRTVASLLLNITTRGEDDDAKSTGGPKVVGEPLNADELAQLVDLCEAKDVDRPKLIEWINAERPKGHPPLDDLKDLPKARLKAVTDAIALKQPKEKAGG